MSAITARAPALVRCAPRLGLVWLPPMKPIGTMPAAWAADTPAGESSTTMQSAGVDAHLGRDVQEQVRRRLAAGNVARREQVGLEEPQQSGAFQAHPDAVERRGGGHAFRPAQPGQRMLDMGGGAQLGAQPPQRGGGQRRGEIRRQLALRRGLDVGEHVDRAAAGKETRRRSPATPRSRRASAPVRRHFGHDRFAVDQHAVAVEDEHGRSPTRPASRQRCLRALK